MRVLICGDRKWNDRYAIYREVVSLIQKHGESLVIIEGECDGADKLARDVAESLGVRFIPFPADWTKYGKAAGPIRNKQMLNEGRPHLVIAFHDAIYKSKGTHDMLTQAMKAGIPTKLFTS